MGNLNKVQLIGHICADPEKKVTNSGVSVVSVSLATTEKWKDKQTQQMQEKTEFHRLVVWQGADVFCQYLKKGSQVYIEGSLQTKEWQDKDNNKRYTTEVNVRSFQFLDKPQQQNQQQNANQPPPQNQSNYPDDHGQPF